MIVLTLNLPKKVEKVFEYLEETTQKPCEYHSKETLIRYVEDMKKIFGIILKNVSK